MATSKIHFLALWRFGKINLHNNLCTHAQVIVQIKPKPEVRVKITLSNCNDCPRVTNPAYPSNYRAVTALYMGLMEP